jgi:hypothetical protein
MDKLDKTQEADGQIGVLIDCYRKQEGAWVSEADRSEVGRASDDVGCAMQGWD